MLKCRFPRLSHLWAVVEFAAFREKMSSTKHRTSAPWKDLHTDTGIAHSCLAIVFPWTTSPAHLRVGMGSTAQLWLSLHSCSEKIESKWKQHHNSILHMGLEIMAKHCAKEQWGSFPGAKVCSVTITCVTHKGCRLDRILPLSWSLGVELWMYHVTSLVILFLGTH